MERKKIVKRFGPQADAWIEDAVLKGTLVPVRRHLYTLPERTKLRVGILRVKGKRAEVRTERGTLKIPLRRAMGAMNGDLIVAGPERGEEGRVVRILKRCAESIPGFVVAERRKVLFRPFRRNLPDFTISGGDEVALNDRTGVMGEIRSYPTPARSGKVHLGEIIGSFGEKDFEVKMVYTDNNWTIGFPSSVLGEAERAAALPIPSDRLDLREKEIFTIDGEYARDFDDAVSLEREGKGWLLGIHIADVSHYVRPRTDLDGEAYERATSAYFPTMVVPMLPEVLSNGVCSLRPDEDRLAVSLFVRVDGRGRLSRPKLARSIIRSSYRMTYSGVQAILDGQADHPLKETLMAMNTLAVKFHRKRVRQGGLDFDLPDVGIIYDAQGQMVGIKPRVRLASHRLIEEFMIVANTTVATLLKNRRVPILYRIHEPPDRGKLLELGVILEGLGYPFKVNLDEITSLQVQRLMASWEDRPEAPYLDELLLRTLARARYTPHNVGHFGLALSSYCHFTSPIRRYPDLVVHRAIKAMLGRKRRDAREEEAEIERLEEVGEHCSTREAQAEWAERDIMEWKTLLLLEGREGETFQGRVSGVIETGIFVLLTAFNIQGFVPFSSYRGDYLAPSTLSQSVSGSRTSFSVKLGDEVRVKIKRIDIHRRYLRLTLR